MQDKIKQLLAEIQTGNFQALAKGITLVENELPGYESILSALAHTQDAKVLGITGPPGAGKSTLVNALLHYWTKKGKKIAVIAVDPTSPFNYGAILGDRIRMSDFYNDPKVFIRSLATRGELGGLHPKIIEITDLVKNAGFDLILVETVGVGQSEVEIAGLADCTVVTLVPQSGDMVQTIKAGIMEIADIFVINKADHSDTEAMYNNLRIMAHEQNKNGKDTPVIKTIATSKTGIEELAIAVEDYLAQQNTIPTKRMYLLIKKCWQLIQADRVKDINKKKLEAELAAALQQPGFNIYSFINNFLRGNKS